MRRFENNALLAGMCEAVTRAGAALSARFGGSPPPTDRAALMSALHANDAVSEAVLRPLLTAAYSAARWDEDEDGHGPLGDGDWWVCDPAEGNINLVQRRVGWCVTATLVRDNRPLLTAAHLPLTGETYSAVHGAGAHRNGEALEVSKKTELSLALVATAQARAGDEEPVHREFERSVGQMLDQALLVRMSVPSTIEMIAVAEGQLDGFWQPSALRAGLMCGALLIAEAGGTVTDVAGMQWTASSKNFVGAGPGIHSAMIEALTHGRNTE